MEPIFASDSANVTHDNHSKANLVTTGLVRALGPGMAAAIVIGNVIGAGIFLKPGEAAAKAGSVPLALAAWVAGGVLSLLGALTIAELALRLPQAGGLYVYIREAFGRRVAFLFGWSEFVIGIPASIGALADGVAGMVGAIARQELPIAFKAVVSISLIAVLAVTNVAGVIWGGRTQVATTSIKCAFLLVLALLPWGITLTANDVVDVGHYRETSLSTLGEDASHPARFSAALLAVLWAYSGWHAVAPVAEEVKEPHRNIPLALIGGGLFTTLLYIAVVLAYHGTLSIAEIEKAGIQLPQTMLQTILSPFGASTIQTAVAFVSLAAIVSMTGSLNSNLMSGPRVGFAMARDGIFPDSLSRVHERFHTPAASILFQAGIAIALVVVSTVLVATFERFRGETVFSLLTNYVTFIASIFLTLAVAAIFPIRRSSEVRLSYTTPFYPLTPILFILVSLVFVSYIFISMPTEALAGVGLTTAGLPFYWWFTRTRK